MAKKQALNRDFWRTLFKTRARFLSILAMIALGVGFFAGINATEPDMILSADRYYQTQNLADFRVFSPLGFQADDIARVRSLPDVARVEPGYTKDLFLDSPAGTTSIVRLYSFQAASSATGSGAAGDISRPSLLSGRLPVNPGEIAIESGSNVPADIQIGSQVSVAVPADEDLADTLRTIYFTVVGIVRSPTYISIERGQTNIGDGAIAWYAYINAADFARERYSDLYIRATASGQLLSYSADYSQAMQTLETALDQIGVASITAETTKMRDDINEGKSELATNKAKAEKELADAEQQLVDAEQKIADGEAELTSQSAKYSKLFAEKRDDLADGQAQLRTARRQYEDGLKLWQAGYEDYQAGAAKAAKAKAQLDAAAAELAAGEKSLAASKAQLDQTKNQLDGLAQQIAALQAIRQSLPADGTELSETEYNQIIASIDQVAPDLAAQIRTSLPYGTPDLVVQLKASLDTAIASYQATLDGGRQQYEAGLAQYEAGVAQLAASRQQYEQGLAEYQAGQQELAKARQQLDRNKAKLDQAKARLDASQAQLDQGEKDLAKAEREFQQKMADGWAEITQARIDLAQGKIEFADQKYTALAEIADAEAQIRDAERQLVELPQEWFVWNRDDNPGYSGYGDDADRIGAVAKVFPLFFFLVAALVCLTTMTRMVEEERLQVGTLKALGYGSGLIAAKYLAYALAASVIGTTVGLISGFKLFPGVIMSTYGLMYSIPVRLMPFHLDYALISLGLAVVTTVSAALAATLQELRATPAVLMLPKAPRPGKRIFLERIRPLWRNLSFSHKVTARNLFRYKKRLLMTVIGIAGCTGLLVTGFGLRDSINAIMDRQFAAIFIYDGQIILDTDKILSAADLQDMLAGQPAITSSLPISSETVTVLRTGVARSYEANLTIPQDTGLFPAFYDLHDRLTQTAIALPADGAIVSEKLAALLSLRMGDTFSYRDVENRTYELRVAGIAENYLQHFIYLSPAYFDTITYRTPVYNVLAFNLSDPATVDEKAMKEAFMSHDGVLTTIFTRGLANDFSDTIKSLNYVVLLLIISAGALAFVVLYNLTNINITERIREIATIKVLGFRDREVSAYVYRENLLLTAGGILLGLLLGSILHRFVMSTMEIDSMMFGKNISLLSYGLSIVLTFVFSTLVNYFMFHKLRHIKMVESLKSVE